MLAIQQIMIRRTTQINLRNKTSIAKKMKNVRAMSRSVNTRASSAVSSDCSFASTESGASARTAPTSRRCLRPMMASPSRLPNRRSATTTPAILAAKNGSRMASGRPTGRFASGSGVGPPPPPTTSKRQMPTAPPKRLARTARTASRTRSARTLPKGPVRTTFARRATASSKGARRTASTRFAS